MWKYRLKRLLKIKFIIEAFRPVKQQLIKPCSLALSQTWHYSKNITKHTTAVCKMKGRHLDSVMDWLHYNIIDIVTCLDGKDTDTQVDRSSGSIP